MTGIICDSNPLRLVWYSWEAVSPSAMADAEIVFLRCRKRTERSFLGCQVQPPVFPGFPQIRTLMYNYEAQNIQKP